LLCPSARARSTNLNKIWFWERLLKFVDIVTWHPKAEIKKSEEMSIARQLLGKYIPAVTNMQATIK
jgi:hypothetical protein